MSCLCQSLTDFQEALDVEEVKKKVDALVAEAYEAAEKAIAAEKGDKEVKREVKTEEDD